MMDPKRLSKAICQEFETATAKCAGFANKDIVLLIGCCGSGKTTVTSYALGTDFRYNRRTQKLEADNPMEGFVTSAQCADVTKGLMSAEVPNTNGLQLVDNAGTGATEGPIAEVCGAINRSLAVQSARSVRVFLVIKEARGDVGNERGRVLLKDVEHVASMFCRLENLGSVGLIVTSEPRGLSVPGVACEVSKSMYDNFNELLETALAEDEYVDLGAAEAPSHMKTTVAGKRLLEHFAASCDKANKIAEEFKEGEDDSFLGQVCERVAIFPVNVSRSQQRLSLQKWLHNLPAVQNPGEALKYVLLSDAKKDLEQTLSKFFLDCKHSIGERGVSCASDEVLVSKIMDLLSLTQTLEETELMPTAASYRTDLVAQLVRENERVNTMVLEGVRSGNPEKIEGVWPAMVKMDAFRQLCAGVHIPGWMKSAAVMTRGIVVAKESLDRHLPGGCTDARWDFNLALQVKGILSAVQQLEPLGAEVLKSWASALSDHVKGLQKSAGDCKNAASVIHALKCLEEHREFLPRTLMPILGPYGCQILEGDGLSVAEEAAKDAVQASLANLSGKMVETVLQSGSSAASEQLMQLCRSTELNGILGKDLEDEYVLKPMSTNLAPSQGDIDSLVKTMETSLTDEWHSQLLSINERMAAAGEHGPRLLSSVELKLDGFSAAASKRICKSKDAVTDAIKKLLAQKCLPEVCERSWAALSLNEIPEEIQDTDSDRDVVEEAETAINELELLLPVDTLLKVMRPNLKVQTETVTVALQCIAWTLNKNLSDALKRTTRRARDKAFIPTHSLGAEVIRAMGQLKSLASLAETLAKTLQSLQDHACSTLAEKLSSLVKAANGFVDDVVKKEMEEWAQADTNVSGWRELFTRHLKMANRLQSLDNDQGHVRSAFAALFQKVKMWRDECFKQATEALETGDFLENPASWIRFVQSCVKEGLAFEQSELCEQLGFQAQFRPLVEAQCEICHQEAASTHQNLKLVTWQKLTTLISALQQLQSEDPRVAKCVKSLKESREPLNLALEDDESRFEKALSEGRFAQAAQLLRKVHSRQRHGDRLKEYLLEAMGSASKSIDDDTEVETLISAVKDARRLIQEVDGMEDAEMAAYAKSQRDELEKKLARLQAVLKTEALDLTVVEQYLLQRKDVGRQALDSANFHQFNSEVKVCKLVSEELVEVPAAFKILADLENDLRERFLNQHLNKLRSAQNIPDAATASQEARKVANSAPDTHEWVTSALEDAFQDLQNKEAFNVQGLATLGMILVQTPLGQTIVAEHPDFFGAVKDMHSNESFRRAGENQNLDEIVGRLTSVSGLDGTEYHELVAALRNHEEQFDQLKNKYLYHGVRPLEDILQEAKTDLDMAVQACNCQDKSAEAVSKLVSHLSVCFTLVKSGKKFLQADVSQQERKLVIPHRGQMLTLFRFLQCHKAVQPDALWKRIFNWVHDKVCGQPENSQQPDNHLAQVLTGEGKCLTLGLLASFLALNGLESDIVCYRKFLIEQDREFMRPFFKFLGVEEKIRYMTFDELCEERLAHIRQASKELIESGKVTTARSQGQFANRACLIDEVDVVFARNFYGNTWDGGFKLTSPQAVGLVSHIFSEVTAGRPIKNIADTDEFQDLLEAYPEEMRGVLTQKAAELVQNVEEWSKPEPILDEKTGRIGYKEKDEVSYDISYSNQTTFAYLSFLQQGKLTPEQVQEQIGIDMLCGRFSFADLPNSYACILGVTGTLMELRSIEGFETVLQNEYGFKHFTITPSIFAGGRLLFNPGEHVQVHAVEEEWGLGLERLVAEHTTRGDSVLVFFKNETQMKKYPGWANMQCLTERTNPKSRKGYIAAATAEGKATLLTRAYGRGIDFQMPEKHRLVVIQTYLSSLVSEEQQIKGRTARHGKSGLFLQVLCAQHLEGKMAFSPEDVNSLRNLKGDQIQSLLKAKQTAKTSSKFFGMAERRNRARHLEAETRKWESLLFGDAETSQKLKRLTTFNQIGDPVHYSVLLDISSSMSGKRKQHMDVAFSKFREQLCEQERQGINTMASVVLFNHTTQVIAPTHVKASELQDIAHRQVGGWTCFHNAFAACRTLISKRSKTQELILFLTDGEAECPERELTALLADHGNRIKCITCVALGAQAGKSVLKNIGAKFEAKNISFNLYDANSEESLVTAFQEAAGCAIHCK